MDGPANKRDYTKYPMEYIRGLKCLNYNHYNEEKTLCPLRMRGKGVKT